MFEHFDILDVIKRGAKALRTAEIDTVNIYANALIAGWLVAV